MLSSKEWLDLPYFCPLYGSSYWPNTPDCVKYQDSMKEGDFNLKAIRLFMGDILFLLGLSRLTITFKVTRLILYNLFHIFSTKLSKFSWHYTRKYWQSFQWDDCWTLSSAAPHLPTLRRRVNFGQFWVRAGIFIFTRVGSFWWWSRAWGGRSRECWRSTSPDHPGSLSLSRQSEIHFSVWKCSTQNRPKEGGLWLTPK